MRTEIGSKFNDKIPIDEIFMVISKMKLNPPKSRLDCLDTSPRKHRLSQFIGLSLEQGLIPKSLG